MKLSFTAYVLIVLGVLTAAGFVLAFTVAPGAINMGVGCGIVFLVALGAVLLSRVR